MIAAIPLISSALSLLTSGDSTSSANAAKAASGPDFNQVMGNVSTEAMSSLKKAESIATDGLSGKANVQAVVQAVMTAQENLQAALAIRDKAVAAFTEVTHMSL